MHLPHAFAQCRSSGDHPLHFLGMHAQARLHGNLLDMHLHQRFRNPGQSNVEISYSCPLPWGAVLLAVDVRLNGQQLQGEVLPKAKAREQYEAALEEGNSSVLVSVNADGSLGMELGNLLAGEECEIHLHYSQVLLPAQGSLRCMLPTTMSPRYGDAVRDGGFEPHLAPQASPLVQYPFSAEIHIEGELAQALISSPSHRISTQLKNGSCVLRLSESQYLDRDLVIQLDALPSTSMASVACDLTQPEESVVMACLNTTLSQQELTPRAVQVQFLLDCSGSMHGDSIDSARSALLQMLKQLGAEDQFSLSKFGSEHQHCHARMVSMDSEQREHALNWARHLQADMGGTEMEAAVVSTLGMSGPGRRDLLLITDGEVHAIDALIETARRKAQRIFIVGIGASPAEQHLRRLALATGGSCEFVAPGEDAQPAILRMFHRLRSPVLTRLHLELPPDVQLLSAQPLPLHAFADEQLLVHLHIRGTWSSQQPLQLSGHVDGAPEPLRLAHCLPQTIVDQDNSLARMAAHALIKLQPDMASMATDLHPLSDEQQTELALRYQLITEHTHFVLVHERAEQDKPVDLPELVQVPHMLAAGWGGTGSVMAAASSNVPSVWRTHRKSSNIQVLSAPSELSLEMPAFLRISADIPADAVPQFSVQRRGIRTTTPAAFVKALLKQDLATLQQIDALRTAGLADEIALWLEQQISTTLSEAAVVQHFVRALMQLHGNQWQEPATTSSEEEHFFIQALTGITDQSWPSVLMQHG
ncbi:VWA domain-containing protein [Comamonas testosteroni]|uniref:VWA domain-containing protein n=1 Tax=Comamonas testosteroni TaxID=285 RepID=A0A373FE31_COMTE|nr:VIT and VWA domain-containing protein [Comamonas testosteroni]RGE42404.1 VWA domain-containing protein [Comamonas testosteroni]